METLDSWPLSPGHLICAGTFIAPLCLLIHVAYCDGYDLVVTRVIHMACHCSPVFCFLYMMKHHPCIIMIFTCCIQTTKSRLDLKPNSHILKISTFPFPRLGNFLSFTYTKLLKPARFIMPSLLHT